MPNEVTKKEIEETNNKQIIRASNYLWENDLLTQMNFEHIKTCNPLIAMQEAKRIVTATSKMHSKIIKLSVLLFPHLEEDGLCRGIALTWLYALLQDNREENEEDFVSHLINKVILEKTADSLKEKIELVKEKVKNESKNKETENIMLDKNEKDLVSILGLLNSIVLYGAPSEFTDYFNQPLSQPMVNSISQRVPGSANDKPLKKINTITNICTLKEIQEYLILIKNVSTKLCKQNKYKKLPSGFLFTSKTHATALVYNPVKNNWLLMDPNDWPVKILEGSEITEALSCIKEFLYKKKKEEEYFEIKIEHISTNADENYSNAWKKEFSELSEKHKEKITTNSLANRLLYFAALCNNVTATQKTVEQCKKLNLDPNQDNQSNSKFSTPLHLAASRGYANIIKALSKLKTNNINAKNKYGQTPLHLAALNGHADAIKALINLEADINAKDNNGQTPLHLAALNGHADAIKALINLEADINAKDNNGQTPLHLAALNGHADAIKALINLEADINAKDNNGQTPLHLAALNGHADAIEALIKLKANINAKDNNGKTPLHIAVLSKHVDAIEALINLEADINAKNNNGNTIFHGAIRLGNERVISKLFELCPEMLKTTLKTKDKKRGYTPLHSIAKSKRGCNTMELLFKLYPKKMLTDIILKIEDDKGYTPFHLAVKGGRGCNTINLLSKFCPEMLEVALKTKDKNGLTPLDLIVKLGYEKNFINKLHCPIKILEPALKATNKTPSPLELATSKAHENVDLAIKDNEFRELLLTSISEIINSSYPSFSYSKLEYLFTKLNRNYLNELDDKDRKDLLLDVQYAKDYLKGHTMFIEETPNSNTSTVDLTYELLEKNIKEIQEIEKSKNQKIKKDKKLKATMNKKNQILKQHANQKQPPNEHNDENLSSPPSHTNITNKDLE